MFSIFFQSKTSSRNNEASEYVSNFFCFSVSLQRKPKVFGGKNVDIFTPLPHLQLEVQINLGGNVFVAGSSIQLEENFLLCFYEGKTEKNEGAAFERMFILIHPEMSGMH